MTNTTTQFYDLYPASWASDVAAYAGGIGFSGYSAEYDAEPTRPLSSEVAAKVVQQAADSPEA